jgi:heme/copper-type cytochrome/quinol oxidase subunit 2
MTEMESIWIWIAAIAITWGEIIVFVTLLVIVIVRFFKSKNNKKSKE